MHTGEELFQLDWQAYAVMGVLLVSYMVLTFANKLPRMAALKDFLDAINSAGGHILILAIFTAWSVKISMQLIYHLLAMGEAVAKSDALQTAGMAYVTGTLSGSFIGALLKTMSGGKANGVGSTPDKLDVGFKPAEGAK